MLILTFSVLLCNCLCNPFAWYFFHNLTSSSMSFAETFSCLWNPSLSVVVIIHVGDFLSFLSSITLIPPLCF